ncbi:hypothetical protein LZ198_00940 [Myxococcus sp. K15C18031901]|uniref:hypothetical protein n=1 Tax=Myxococcus dinghuensis TaxID=2906761 RepID=UPI0020A76FC7|nr:hypothetical protein [Myxococcus dinghuensis]MCP3097432.1 hypothetical protein [Myxococcus dinghuensis]
MYVSRKSAGFQARTVLALALGLALVACSGDDKSPDGDGGTGEDITTTVSGKVTFDFVPATYSPTTRSGTLAFNQSTEKPVRKGVVQVRKGTTLIAETTTDEQGNFSLTYTAEADSSVTLYALAKTLTPAIQVEDNTNGNAIWALGTPLTVGTTSKNIHATHGWTGRSFNTSQRSAAPFAILDSMYTASRAFMDVRPVTFPALKVNWSPNNVPQSGSTASGNIGTSHYNSRENEIYVLGKDGVDTDEFDDHVIVHEWGHFFESNLSRSDSIGGSHASGDVLDPRVSFGEGYGNGLSAILLPSSIYADTSWGGGALGAFGFDMESAPTPNDDTSPGVFSELSVMRFLYDLYDAPTVGEAAYDQVNLDLGIIYDVLVGPQKTTPAFTTVGSFIHGLKAQLGVDNAAVDRLAAHYNIGSIRSPFGEGDSALAAMYTNVTVPYNATPVLTGGDIYNKQVQNRYYVFSGTGRTITVKASSNYDVGIEALGNGTQVGAADDFVSGAETFSFASRADMQYVLVLTGYTEQAKSYMATLSITSQ